MDTPVVIAAKLKLAGFTDDQADEIAAEIFQPLQKEIRDIERRLNELVRATTGVR